MIVKNEKEKAILQEGGRRLALILEKVSKMARAGMKVSDLDKFAENLALEMGDKPAFKNYKPKGAERPYPASLSVSVNDEVVHGIPNEETKILKDGDILTLDIGLTHEGLITDHAVTIPIGNVDKKGMELIETTKKALDLVIKRAKPGVLVGELGDFIENFAKQHNFVPAEDLGGHGVGRTVHEEPFVPNFGPRDREPTLREGEVIAIEPIFNEGGTEIILMEDGYTLKTKDGKRSAQFEHTVLIEKEGAVILTKI